jgi:hypothetical protein
VVFLTFDFGLKLCHVLDATVYDISNEFNPHGMPQVSPKTLEDVTADLDAFKPSIAMIEYQAPMEPLFATRNNSYVEGYFRGLFNGWDTNLKVVTVMPRSLDVTVKCKSSGTRKTDHVAFARKVCDNWNPDWPHHVADALLNAYNYFLDQMDS